MYKKTRPIDAPAYGALGRYYQDNDACAVALSEALASTPARLEVSSIFIGPIAPPPWVLRWRCRTGGVSNIVAGIHSSTEARVDEAANSRPVHRLAHLDLTTPVRFSQGETMFVPPHRLTEEGDGMHGNWQGTDPLLTMSDADVSPTAGDLGAELCGRNAP